jgi:signal transduction histidine kinase
MNIFQSVVKKSKNYKIIVATLVLFLIFLSGFIYESYISYKGELHRAEVETINLTRVLQEHINGSFKSIDLVLTELQKVASNRHDPKWLKKDSLNNFFLERRLSLPQLRSFKAVDKNGEYIVDDSGLINTVNLSDRDYFQMLKKTNTDELVISKPVISKRNHIWVIVLARRLVDGQGNFDGIVFGTIPLEYFKEQFEKLDLGEGGVLSLLDSHMTIHMRIPWSESYMGRAIKARDYMMKFFNSNELFIVSRSVSEIDNIERLYTTRKLENYPFVVIVGLSTKQILESWTKRTTLYAVSIFFLFTFFLIFLFIFLRSQDQLEEQRNQAIQASKLSSLGEMAGGIAHEINNPLTIISALATRTKKNLLDKNVPIEKSFENLDKIIVTVDRIAKIIKGLRAFSRDSNGEAFKYKKVSEIVEMTLELCQERFRDNGIEIKQYLNPDVEVHCREIQIVQVLVNLLSNSLDAISEQPVKWIEISVSDLGGTVMIRVKDSGKGIHQNVVDQIMLPFFTTKEVGKGTGLGLSISKGIIEAHEGRFYYELYENHTSFVLELKKYLTKS